MNRQPKQELVDLKDGSGRLWLTDGDNFGMYADTAPDTLAALQFFCDATGPMFFNITPETEGTLTSDRRQILRAYRNAQAVMLKARGGQ